MTHIRISTCVQGKYKDWDLDEEAINDQGVLEESMRELNCYLEAAENRGEDGLSDPLDGNGSFVSQVGAAILAVMESGKRASLVMADSETTEITVDMFSVGDEVDVPDELLSDTQSSAFAPHP